MLGDGRRWLTERVPNSPDGSTTAPPSTPNAPPPAAGIARTLARGLAKRCGACGGKGIVTGWGTLTDRCPTCGLWLERSNGMSMGSLGMNTIASFSSLFAVEVLGLIVTWPDFEVGLLLLVAVLWGVLFPTLFHTRAKTLWLAVDLLLRPMEPDERGDVRPPMRG